MDCLEGMKLIPDKSIDMILCDLPYGTTACKWDNVIPFEPLWEQYKRIIKDNGAIVLFGSQPFTSALVMSNPKMFRYEWIWKKTKATLFQHANKMPLRNHENICVFYKKLPTYNPQKVYVGIKDKRKTFTKRKNNEEFTKGGLEVQVRKDDGWRFPVTVQEFNNSDKTKQLHPTQKPVALLEYLIKTYTNEGETVLDNCMGSGTTAIACINTNRNYIGFELDKNYYDIANKRIEEHKAVYTE
ncbi:MAG TPA: site-specific DNA-methyltransferase [Acholeplasmataceae bacterium]|nr:site-specific DNA-methyltransferase [Acholeplasmataceae bacterium]